MQFKENILQFADDTSKRKSCCKTEESVKTSLVLPFIQFLGYDIFNPEEVIPEYTCDVGIKKGEKIDYAICRNNSPILLIECKNCDQNLNLYINQLYRYYTTTSAKIAILTNGIEYKVFADTLRPNIMDTEPFFEFNITQLSDYDIAQIVKFKKIFFNADLICETILGIKYFDNKIRHYEEAIIAITEQKQHKIQSLTNEISELQNIIQLLSNERNKANDELVQLKNKIAAEEEEKIRIKTEKTSLTTQNNITEQLIDYLNMPVPKRWAIMTCKERQAYWHNKTLWNGIPRDCVCTTEVAKEFFRHESRYLGSDGRRYANEIRMTELFIQTGEKRRFGEYGVQLAWIRRTKLGKKRR